MDINRWRSVAIAKEDYSLLKGLCKNKFRAPGAMVSKLVNDYVAFLAKKEKTSVDTMRKKLLNGSKE
jgi:hypothetical protein